MEPCSAVGNDYRLTVPSPLGDDFKIKFILSVRDQQNIAIVEETLRHFCFAVYALANGIQADESKQTRTETEDLGFNRVLISYASLPIFREDGDGNKDHVWKKALIFSENTSAADYMDMMKFCAFEVDSLASELGLEITSNAVAPRSTPNGNNTPQPTKQAATGDTLENLIAHWDYRQKEEYEQQYKGQQVNVRFGNARREMNTYKDKPGTYEVIEFYPVMENGMIAEKPMYDLSIYIPTPERADTAYDYKTLNKGGFVDTYLPIPGTSLDVAGTLRFKINPSKKEEGKFYWNLYGMMLDEQPDAAEYEVRESDERVGEQRAQKAKSAAKRAIDNDEIPW